MRRDDRDDCALAVLDSGQMDELACFLIALIRDSDPVRAQML